MFSEFLIKIFSIFSMYSEFTLISVGLSEISVGLSDSWPFGWLVTAKVKNRLVRISCSGVGWVIHTSGDAGLVGDVLTVDIGATFCSDL